MKKTLSIFLLIIICINHLNLIDTVLDFTARFKKETCQKTKSVSNSAESESEKEDKGKVKSEEQEKYFTRSIYQLKSNFQLSDRDKFICFNSMLNKNPYQDDDIEPPQAV